MKCPRCTAENLPDSRFCHKCATPLPWEDKAQPPITQTLGLTAELERGSLLAARYEVIEEIGRGGMGRVYKVFDRKVREVVALKLIRPEISVSEKAVERFKNELRFARKIAHRHVCRMYDVGEEGLTHFLTMEYVPGEDLKAFIRRSGQLTPAKAVSLARQTAEGLAEAHRLGVIHRDLKPQNIMIDGEGNARIMDFGIARIQEVEGLTGSGVFIGTPEYMSPEQAELKNVDSRTDIYSLGVVLFEMLTGRAPFEGETPLGIAMKHKSEPPRSPSELNPHVPADLASVVLKALAKDPDRRYQSAEEMASDLEAASGGFPLTDARPARREPITSREITVKFQLKKLIIPGVVLAAAALTAVLLRPVVFPGKRAAASPPGTGVSQPAVRPGAQGTAEKNPGLSAPLSRLGSEAIRILKAGDLSELNDAEKFLETIRAVLPSDSNLQEAVSSASDKVRETKKLNEEGRTEEAQRAGREGREEMQKLMAQVAERDGALEARAAAREARGRAERGGRDERNLLFRLSGYEEKNAEAALARDDFAGARTLFNVLSDAYQLSLKAATDEEGCRILQKQSAEMEREIRAKAGPDADAWLLENAAQLKAQADAYLGRKEYENAAACSLQALFLFRKMRGG
jgi:serine/threonine-protein kinase